VGLRPAVFCDRDGTLNVDDEGYINTPDLVKLLPGVAEALRALKGAGWALVVVSNQSGIGRGRLSLEELHRVNERLEELLAAEGAELDGIYFCPHAPDEGCSCRKPKPGMLLEAARELGLDLRRSWMVGDKADDVKAGRAAGCRTALVRTGEGEGAEAEHPDIVAADFPEAARKILEVDR